MRARFTIWSLAVCSLVAAACGDDAPEVSGSSSGFAGAGGSPQLNPPGQVVNPVPMQTPPGFPVQPPPVSGGTVAPPSTCEGTALENGRGFVSRRCADCVCGIQPMSTFACTRDCWTLAFCAADAGCDAGDLMCVAQRCNATGDVNVGISAAAMQIASVPFAECSAECFGEPGSKPPAQTACEPLRAEPASAAVGDTIALAWDPLIGDGEYNLSVTPWASVGSLREVDGRMRFRCDAPGEATIAFDSDRCANAPLSVTVKCTAREDMSCCPIQPLGEGGGSCSELGGSPPCLVGCGCLRDGGAFYTELDAQGCLQWVLRPALDSAEHLVCLDQDGNPNPDPRHMP